MKFALFSGSAPEWDLATVAENAARQGWDGIDWRVTDQAPAHRPGFVTGNLATIPQSGVLDHAAEVARVSTNSGLVVPMITGYVAVDDEEKVEIILQATRAMGAAGVRLQVPKAAPGVDYRSEFARTRANCERVALRAATHGVRALIQIHHGTLVATASAAFRLLDGLDPSHIGAMADLGNQTIEGREGLQTWVPSFEILGPYLAYARIKNAIWKVAGTRDDGTVDWAWEWASLRAGMGDVPGYLAALTEVGYDGWVTVEDFTTQLPTEVRLADDLAYVRANTTAG